jgi:hypothetical protein
MASETAETLQGDKVRQFSIFLENKVGRLAEIVKLFADYNVHIVAINVIDSAETGIVRLVVDDPERSRALLAEHNITHVECILVVVELSSSSSDLKGVLSALLQAECNIHFTYSFLTRPRGKAALALHVDDQEVATHVLSQAGYKLLTQKDISR